MRPFLFIHSWPSAMKYIKHFTKINSVINYFYIQSLHKQRQLWCRLGQTSEEEKWDSLTTKVEKDSVDFKIYIYIVMSFQHAFFLELLLLPSSKFVIDPFSNRTSIFTFYAVVWLVSWAIPFSQQHHQEFFQNSKDQLT